MDTTTFSTSRVIHIHTGLHASNNELSFPALVNMVAQAANAGYKVIDISGEEPFLYSSLEALLRFAKCSGCYNTVTTSGLFLKGTRAKKILNYLDLVSVTIDGKEAVHDRLRMQTGAFKKMREGIAILKDSIAQYGFMHSLRPDSSTFLSWLTSFAVDEKAVLLHLHPGELATPRFGSRYDQPDLYRIYTSYCYLKTYFENDISIQLDWLHRTDFKNGRPRLCTCRFSTIFKELIINDRGDLFVAPGYAPCFTIGNIYSGETLQHMIDRFANEKMDCITELYQATYDEIMHDKELEIINWSRMLLQKSYTLLPVVAA